MEQSQYIQGDKRARKRPVATSDQNRFEETYFVSSTSFNPPPIEDNLGNEDEKNHGRKFLRRITGSLSSILTQKKSSSVHYSDEKASVSDMSSSSIGRNIKTLEIEYYEDNFNDQSWNCSFGTSETDGVWMNREDPPGTILSVIVVVLIVYSSLTVLLLSQTQQLPPILAMTYFTLAGLSVASHFKTTFTDPGSVPESAVPIESSLNTKTCHTMCSQCQTYKPPLSHHCRICNRCVSRMDHHCPWMNNCIGAGNLKHFILFLVYTWLGCALSLFIFAWNYFLCSDERCEFSNILVELVRVMTVICIVTLLFTSSMIMSVTYGVITGIGTIDRLKKKANNVMQFAMEEPIPLKDIFGIGGYYTWPFPIDPVFEDYDRVMGYSTPQRLLREETSGGKSSKNRSSEFYSRVSDRDYAAV